MVPLHQGEWPGLPSPHTHPQHTPAAAFSSFPSGKQSAQSPSPIITPLLFLPGPCSYTSKALCYRLRNAYPPAHSPVLLWGELRGRPSPICTWTQLPRGGPRGGGSGSWGPDCFRSSVSVLWEESGEKQPSQPPAFPSARPCPVKGQTWPPPSYYAAVGSSFNLSGPPFSPAIDLTHLLSPTRHDLWPQYNHFPEQVGIL